MHHHRALALGLLLSVCILPACTPRPASIDTGQRVPVRPGMTEAEVIEHLGVPALITEQPRLGGPGPVPAGEKRRYTYYYLRSAELPDTLITFEDGVVIKVDQRRP